MLVGTGVGEPPPQPVTIKASKYKTRRQKKRLRCNMAALRLGFDDVMREAKMKLAREAPRIEIVWATRPLAERGRCTLNSQSKLPVPHIENPRSLANLRYSLPFSLFCSTPGSPVK